MNLKQQLIVLAVAVGGIGYGLLFSSSAKNTNEKKSPERPNILFLISDDQSWLHTSIAGDAVVKTPGFDHIAEQGILFNNAFCSAPSCTPSRGSILTGQEMWRLEEGGLLFGGLPDKFPLFTKELEKAGYKIGYTGKTYWPANLESTGYWREPLGKNYSNFEEVAPEGIPGTDYSKNFIEFLQENKEAKPFFFWVGFYEPHRRYKQGIGKESGLDPDSVEVPKFLPDNSIVREDILDYYYEIQWFDKHLQRMLKILEKTGQLENTIIVVTSDNGMPFPHAKANLYEYGTHIPLAICWSKNIKSGRKVDDLVSLSDLAPTFLEIAGIKPLLGMTGISLMNIFQSKKSGQIDPKRNKVVTAIERHTWSRPGGKAYPMRAIRTHEWLYIYNFEPDRWPAGNPPPFKPIFFNHYGDIDDSPTFKYMFNNQKKNPDVAHTMDLAVAKRPHEELYNIIIDPDCINNLAQHSSYQKIRNELQIRLFDYLKKTEDPRMSNKAPWDDYPFYFNNGDFSSPYKPKDIVVN